MDRFVRGYLVGMSELGPAVMRPRRAACGLTYVLILRVWKSIRVRFGVLLPDTSIR